MSTGKEDKSIITDGSFIIDERFDGPKPDILSCPPLQKCCRKKSTIDLTTEFVHTSKEAHTDRKGRSSNSSVCEGFFPTPSRCGKHNSNGLGGSAHSLQNKTLYAQYAEFPWQVAVLVNKRSSRAYAVYEYQSGGSLIHEKVVLTTAHNVANIETSNIMVRAGEWETQSDKEMCKHVERNVDSVIQHESFVRANLRNDVALLVLTSEFPMTPFINTICLPPAGMSFNGQRCWASGWGKTLFGKAGVYQVFLKKLDLPIVPNERCQTLLRNTRLGEDFELHEGFLCAGQLQYYSLSNVIFPMHLSTYYRW